MNSEIGSLWSGPFTSLLLRTKLLHDSLFKMIWFLILLILSTIFADDYIQYTNHLQIIQLDHVWSILDVYQKKRNNKHEWMLFHQCCGWPNLFSQPLRYRYKLTEFQEFEFGNILNLIQWLYVTKYTMLN